MLDHEDLLLWGGKEVEREREGESWLWVEVVEREEGGEEEGEGRGKKGKSELDFPPTCFVCLFFAFPGRVYIK